MVAAGERELAAIAVFTESDPPAMPCGMCRQVLFEFGASAIVVVASPLRVDQTTLRELLPAPFLLKR
jgi:cytidine deaminase